MHFLKKGETISQGKFVSLVHIKYSSMHIAQSLYNVVELNLRIRHSVSGKLTSMVPVK